eukprot:scaffold42036_cov45-Phaeocystis_antarctica.AAC.2
MYGMFTVRSSPCPAPNLQSPRSAYALLATRQYASAFNQPLSFDTSSVTTMYGMFHVRSSPCPPPGSAAEPAPPGCVHRGRPPPPASRATPSPCIVCPPFDSRQSASAFNQPLSFETSSLTDMGWMFRVRSSPRPAPNLQPSPPLRAACTAVARRLPPSRSARRPAQNALLRLSAVRVGVQPAAELRHLQCHRHVRHVQRATALLPVPCPESAVEPSPLHAACTTDAACTTPSASRLPARTSPSTVCPPFDSRQSAKAFNQPLSFDTSSVTTMYAMFSVRSSPCPAPKQSAVEPCPARRCVPRRRLPPPALPACTSPRTVCPPFDSRQNVKAFNQPLSFDTSSVMDMRSMFAVRSSPCPGPNLQPSPAPHDAACPAVACRLPPSLHTSPRTVCPPFGSRQTASAFNQPLSFDTSSVTTMYAMFWVRSSPCPAPILQSSPPLHAACTAAARRLPPPGPHTFPLHRMPSVRLSAVHAGVQPAAELRHLQRHEHAIHVLRALLPLPCPQSAVESSPAPPFSAICRPPSPQLAPFS